MLKQSEIYYNQQSAAQKMKIFSEMELYMKQTRNDSRPMRDFGDRNNDGIVVSSFQKDSLPSD